MKNAVCEKLGIRYPIFQGAMTLISNAELAAAVSSAGGLGILSTGQYRDSTAPLLEQIVRTRKLTDKPFAVNIAFESPIAEDIIRLVCQQGVKAVTTGGGNPAKYIKQFHEASVTVIPVVASVEVAVKMQRAGADMVVAEGMESGGYIGKMSTLALLPQVADAVDIPVIAAGGIADGRGMAASFLLGASGVQIGTRFLVANESDLPAPCKDAIVAASGKDAVVVGERIGAKLRHRSLRTQAVEDILEYEQSTLAQIEEYQERFQTARNRMMTGDTAHAIIGMGQGVGLIRERTSAQEIVTSLIREFDACMERFSGEPPRFS